jgi:hypothetical protein
VCASQIDAANSAVLPMWTWLHPGAWLVRALLCGRQGKSNTVRRFAGAENCSRWAAVYWVRLGGCNCASSTARKAPSCARSGDAMPSMSSPHSQNPATALRPHDPLAPRSMARTTSGPGRAIGIAAGRGLHVRRSRAGSAVPRNVIISLSNTGFFRDSRQKSTFCRELKCPCPVKKGETPMLKQARWGKLTQKEKARTRSMPCLTLGEYM